MRPAVRAVIVGLVALLSPQLALASTPSLQPGVHVDPGSPAGKEYQIPVIGARGETAGGGQAGSTNPPLFGVGVTPGPPSAGSAAASTGSTAASTGSTGAGSSASSQSAASRSRAPHSRSSSRTRLVASSAQPVGGDPASVGLPSTSGSSAGGAGSNGWIPLVAGGLLVLVLGGGGGLALRQRVLRG